MPPRQGDGKCYKCSQVHYCMVHFVFHPGFDGEAPALRPIPNPARRRPPPMGLKHTSSRETKP